MIDELYPEPTTEIVKKSRQEQIEKCEKYMKWCKSKGIMADNCEFPSFFDRDLLGVKASKDIEHR